MLRSFEQVAMGQPQPFCTPTAETPLYFLHIPKTAGTTLYNNLDDRFDRQQIYPGRFISDLLKADPQQLRTFSFFRGHFGYSLQNVLDRPLTYITVLRDPVERCISQYEDVRRVPNNFLHKRVRDRQMSFADFVRDPETQIAIANLQARNLAFDWTPDQMRDNFELIRCGIAGMDLGIPQDELLAIALDRLSQFAVIGVVERFQETAWLLSYRFNWYPIQPPRRLNQAQQRLRRADLDEATLDAVKALNPVDEALYQYANQCFEAQYAAMQADLLGRSPTQPDPPIPLQRAVEAEPSHDSAPDAPGLESAAIASALIQRYEQGSAQRALDQASQQPVESGLYVSMDQALAGENWYNREGLEPGSTPFRWTGPGTTSTLYLSLRATAPLTLQLYIVRAIAPDVLDSLVLTINQQPIPLTPIAIWADQAMLRGHLPPDLVAEPPALTRFTLTVNRTDSIRAIAPESPDPRPVGLAISHLYVFPADAPAPPDPALQIFPTEDPHWMAVLERLRSHLQPGEAIAAPREFLQPFPSQVCGYNALLPKPSGLPTPAWVVVHKGHLDTLPLPALKRLVTDMRPVFANLVFVIFSGRSELDTVPFWARDMRPFWKSYYRRRWLQVIRRP